MQVEWEATFWPIDKDEVRTKLKRAEGTCIHEERLMRRVNFNLPESSPLDHGFIRVRDEGHRITMTVKQTGEAIEEQLEVESDVGSFDSVVEILRLCGLKEKSYQETKRETWKVGDIEVMIDEWPWLPPLVELEGPSEDAVRALAEKMGFRYDSAYFGSTDKLYAKHYNVESKEVTHSKLLFTGQNPFITARNT